MKKCRGTCSTFKVINLTYLHVPTYLLALQDFRPLFNSPKWSCGKNTTVKYWKYFFFFTKYYTMKNFIRKFCLILWKKEEEKRMRPEAGLPQESTSPYYYQTLLIWTIVCVIRQQRYLRPWLSRKKYNIKFIMYILSSIVKCFVHSTVLSLDGKYWGSRKIQTLSQCPNF